MAQALDIAVAGDRITAEELQGPIDALMQMASDLDDLETDTLSVAEIQEIGRAQAQLRSLAGLLVNRQIDLLAGEANITAEHIDSAVRYTCDAVKKTAAVKARLAKVAAVIVFFGAVLTGNGKTIVQAAVKLKGQLA